MGVEGDRRKYDLRSLLPLIRLASFGPFSPFYREKGFLGPSAAPIGLRPARGEKVPAGG
jgi:hypothetical protein